MIVCMFSMALVPQLQGARHSHKGMCGKDVYVAVGNASSTDLTSRGAICFDVHRSFMKEVIRPFYLTLAEQYEDSRAGARPYMVKNYDDLNEMFWQRGCRSLEVVGLTQDAIRKKFTKTFVERQSWLVPMVSVDDRAPALLQENRREI